MRFFIDDLGVEPGQGVIRASELRMNNVLEGFDYEEDDLDIYEHPVVHGYKFENMFNAEREIDMTGRVISAYHFTKQGDFAGLTLTDVAYSLGDETTYMTEELDSLESIKADERYMTINDTTRLVGFRTSLRCRTSQVIKQIQPIYYSIDGEVCRNLLGQIPRGMLEETPAFGNECNSSKISDGVIMMETTAQFNRETHAFEGVTLVCVVLMTIALLILCSIFFSQRKHKNDETRKRQNIEVAEAATPRQ